MSGGRASLSENTTSFARASSALQHWLMWRPMRGCCCGDVGARLCLRLCCLRCSFGCRCSRSS